MSRLKDLDSMGFRVRNGELLVLDQRALPHEELWVQCESPAHMIELIRSLAVRGAPLIGVAAACAIARFSIDRDPAQMRSMIASIRASRPTAVNLMWACDRMASIAKHEGSSGELVAEAERIFEEDIALCDEIGTKGADLISEGDSILTHCNAGALATAGIGTAIGVIRKAFELGKKIHVYVDETRPLLQGARLTAWELKKLGIPHTLICDNMAASLMQSGKIQKIVTGADRIAANGDAANKVGTYGLAVLAHHHKVPFYIAAPYTTVDLACASGAEIPIENRDAEEVRAGRAPTGTAVFNLAFDVTPRELITALILGGTPALDSPRGGC
jgi:methylthioribose-1-phosphate isomerase